MRSPLLFCFLFLFGISSCTHPPVGEGEKKISRYERLESEQYFVSSNVIQYFLSQLPQWANASIGGQCQREYSVHYLNFEKVMGSFGYSYEQVLHFQYSYNVERREIEKKAKAEALPFKDQEKVFFNVSDRVESNILSFKAPDYKRIHLIWVDPALKSKKHLARLKGLMKRSEMDLGHPVFVSLCRYREQLAEFVKENDFRPEIRLMTYEMLSPYAPSGELTPLRHVVIDKLFRSNQRLIFYHPKSWKAPMELKGKFDQRAY